MLPRILAEAICSRIVLVHDMLINTVRDLSEDQFSSQPPNTTAPSIAWHLWHVARWADRHQAGLSDRSGAADRSGALANERWALENLASEWRLDPVRLGVFETGAAMDAQAASLISQVAKERVLAYAQSVFSDFDRRIEQINDDDLLLRVKATANVSFEAGVPDSLTVLPASDTRILDELLFHEGHAARHLGMIEALRGLVMEHGTATV